MDDYRVVTSTKDPNEITGDGVFLGRLSDLLASFGGEGMPVILILANGKGEASMISNLAEDHKINSLLELVKTPHGPGEIVKAEPIQ